MIQIFGTTAFLGVISYNSYIYLYIRVAAGMHSMFFFKHL